MDLKQLQVEAHQIAREHGWHDTERTFGDCIALVHSELSEALKAYRAPAWQGDLGWRWVPILDDETAEIIGNKPVEVASELADVVIRVVDMAEWYGVDLGNPFDQPVFMERPTFGDSIAALHYLVSMTFYWHEDVGITRGGSWEQCLRLIVTGVYGMAAHYGIDLDAAIAAKTGRASTGTGARRCEH